MNFKYLTEIPDDVINYGFCKTLLVRNETIHIKHILTECFVRKTIDIEKMLKKIDWNIYNYLEHITNRLRKIYKFPRTYINNPDKIVKTDRNDLYETYELYNGLKRILILDFDGVCTNYSFQNRVFNRITDFNINICSANPNINPSWFEDKKIYPSRIFSMKGKVKKIKKLIEIQSKNDYCFFIDNEEEYLKYAWILGIQTFHYKNKRLKKFTLNSK